VSGQETNAQPPTRNRICLPLAGGGWRCRLHHSGRLFLLVFHGEKLKGGRGGNGWGFDILFG
jgi:hypothetical protein